MSTISAVPNRGIALTDRMLRSIFLFAATLIFGLNLAAFSSWDQRYGVVDDLCYRRQAHLFQRFGLAGISTDIRKDDDGYFRGLQQKANYDPNWTLCHVPVAKTNAIVIQYPPGTGFIMSFFPESSQVAWLYSVSMLVVMAGIIFAISIASIRASIVAAGLFGVAALYFMVNPTKASYSMAPTTAFCVVAAFLSPLLFRLRAQRHRVLVAGAIGLLLGLTVSFRIANLLLVAGYVAVLGMEFLRKRDRTSFETGAAFALAYLLGLAPALVANYVNAGSPFATTYGAQDVVPADFTFSIVSRYLFEMQGYLAIVAIAATLWMMRTSRHFAPVAIVAVNLVVNLGFFFSHPIFTPYYIMPVLTLALWALLAQWLLENRRSVIQ